MPTDPRLPLAERIHAALLRELGEGVDVRRLLDDKLYARDVLLVCRAYGEAELGQLGAAFTALSRPLPELTAAAAETAPPTDHAAEHPADAEPESPRRLRRWLVPSSWFGR